MSVKKTGISAPLKIKWLHSLDTSESVKPAIQHNIPKRQNQHTRVCDSTDVAIYFILGIFSFCLLGLLFINVSDRRQQLM